jgi:hypothetical protein
MMKSAGSGSAHTGMIAVVDHDVPTDPVKLRKLRLGQASAAIASAKRKVAKLTGFISLAPKGHKAKQQAHLRAAKEALAEAIAHKEGIS